MYKEMKKTVIGLVLISAVLLTGVDGVKSVAEASKSRSVSLSVPARPRSLDPTGMAKPIADLRDYNGTYAGAKGTGSIGYEGGTLYRDNEDLGAASGCEGEGCGRHPGVDMPVN